MTYEDWARLLNDPTDFQRFLKGYSNGVMDALFGNMDAGEERQALELFRVTIDGFVAFLSEAFPNKSAYIKETVDKVFGQEMTERLQAGLTSMF